MLDEVVNLKLALALLKILACLCVPLPQNVHYQVAENEISNQSRSAKEETGVAVRFRLCRFLERTVLGNIGHAVETEERLHP